MWKILDFDLFDWNSQIDMHIKEINPIYCNKIEYPNIANR